LLDKIVSLRTENELLKNSKNYSHLDHSLINNLMTIYDTCHSSCIVEIKLENFKFKRKLQKVEGKINSSRFLSYTINELEYFWKIGDWYNLSSHSIEKIVSQNSISSFQEYAKLLFNLDQLAAKGTPGDYKNNYQLTYIHKKSYDFPAILDSTITFKPIICKIKKTFFKPNNINKIKSSTEKSEER